MVASSRIEKYLRDYPSGDLLLTVGYATPAGMAWLDQHTEGRKVSLLIGDTHKKWYENVSKADRDACLRFLHRSNVEVRNWYRTKKSRSGKSEAHLKVWAVHNNWSPMSALSGSANLTKQGLHQNVEVMVEAYGNDMREAWKTSYDLWSEAWECEDRLLNYLDGPSKVLHDSETSHDESSTSPVDKSRDTGIHTDDHLHKQSSSHPQPVGDTPSTRTAPTPELSGKQVILYTISGWIAFAGLLFSGLVAVEDWEGGILIAMLTLTIAGPFFFGARKSKN